MSSKSGSTGTVSEAGVPDRGDPEGIGRSEPAQLAVGVPARRMARYFQTLGGTSDPQGEEGDPTLADMAWALALLAGSVAGEVCRNGDVDARIRVAEAVDVTADLLEFIQSDAGAA